MIYDKQQKCGKVPDYETVAFLDYDTEILNFYTFSLTEFGYSVKDFTAPETLLKYV